MSKLCANVPLFSPKPRMHLRQNVGHKLPSFPHRILVKVGRNSVGRVMSYRNKHGRDSATTENISLTTRHPRADCILY